MLYVFTGTQCKCRQPAILPVVNKASSVIVVRVVTAAAGDGDLGDFVRLFEVD